MDSIATENLFMQTIIGINHVGIRVTDLATSRRFYEQFGFQFIIGPIGPEPVAVMEHPSGININLILNGTPATPHDIHSNVLMDIPQKYPGYTHIALNVTNLADVEKQLNTQNISITEGPLSLPDGAQMLFIRDPDSNVLEFHQNNHAP